MKSETKVVLNLDTTIMREELNEIEKQVDRMIKKIEVIKKNKGQLIN